MSRSADAYLAQLMALLPPGGAWPTDPGSVLGRVLSVSAGQLARLDARGNELLAEADPRAAIELLAEWEADTGQPDPCAGPALSLDGRRQRVVATLTGRPGGQSRAFFIGLAARYGFTVSITEFEPHTCEASCERPVNDEGWRFTWRVNAAAVPILDLTCESDCETPLRDWGNAILECVIRRAAPAHTTVLFGYGGS